MVLYICLFCLILFLVIRLKLQIMKLQQDKFTQYFSRYNEGYLHGRRDADAHNKRVLEFNRNK